jgi:hypothetical protein
LPSHYKISAGALTASCLLDGHWLTLLFASDRHSSIETYINNLDRGRHPELYTAFAQAFDCALPYVATGRFGPVHC